MQAPKASTPVPRSSIAALALGRCLLLSGLVLSGLVLSGLVLSGCGNLIYAVQVGSASSRLQEAEELGAEKLAPYEYYTAKEHLRKAQEEAADADYSDASNFAEVAEDFAAKAIRLSKEAHRGAGR